MEKCHDISVCRKTKFNLTAFDKLPKINRLTSKLETAWALDRDSPAVEWVNVVLESPRSFFAVLISMEGADQEYG